MSTSKKKKNKKNGQIQKANEPFFKKWQIILICVLAALIVITVILIAVNIFSSDNESTIVAEFVPPEHDSAAVESEPEVDESLGWSELAVSSGYIVKVCGVLNFNSSDNSVPVWFYSCDDNEVWVKLRITDTEGNVLGQSGIIYPGEYVESVVLDTVPDEDCTVYLYVMGYEPETYYSAGSVSLSTTLYMG